MHIKFKHNYFFPILIVTFIIFGTQAINRYVISTNNSFSSANARSVTCGYTIWSIDNQYYNSQFRNYMLYDDFSSDLYHSEFRVRRTPFYPLFVGIPIYFLGECKGLILIYILQTFLHILAAFFVAKIIFISTGSKKIEIIAFILYSLTPFIYFPTNYTITESLTPFFCALIIYCYFKLLHSAKKKVLWSIITGLVIGLSIMHRPLLGIFSIPVAVSLFFAFPTVSYLRKIFIVVTISASSAIVLLPWVIRNYMVLNEIVILEKFYYEDPMDFGKSHFYFRNWVSAFSNPASSYSTEVFAGALRSSTSQDEKELVIKNYIANLPMAVKKNIPDTDLKTVLLKYANCLHERDSLLKENPKYSLKTLSERPIENELKEKFTFFEKTTKNSNILNYYFILPLKTFLRDGIFNSNSSSCGSLSLPNSNLAKIIKGLFFIWNSLLWILGIVGLTCFFRERNKAKRIFSICLSSIVIGFIAFHIWYFRYFETRYFLPLYPILLIFSTHSITWVLRKTGILLKI